jgi:hypothetical protein
VDEPVSDSCPLVGSECESLATSEVSRQLVIVQGGSNMTGTDLCVNKSQFVPVIFEPHCSMLTNILV